jgi:hypothetical protein
MSRPEAPTLLPPGTPIYGLIYGDGSTGGWTHERRQTSAQIEGVREFGLDVIGLLVARLKDEPVEVRP